MCTTTGPNTDGSWCRICARSCVQAGLLPSPSRLSAATRSRREDRLISTRRAACRITIATGGAPATPVHKHTRGRVVEADALQEVEVECPSPSRLRCLQDLFLPFKFNNRIHICSHATVWNLSPPEQSRHTQVSLILLGVGRCFKIDYLVLEPPSPAPPATYLIAAHHNLRLGVIYRGTILVARTVKPRPLIFLPLCTIHKPK